MTLQTFLVRGARKIPYTLHRASMLVYLRPWFVNYSVNQSTLSTFECSPWKSNICHPHLEVISINHRIKNNGKDRYPVLYPPCAEDIMLPCSLPARCRGHYATMFFTRPVQRILCYPVLYPPCAEDIML